MKPDAENGAPEQGPEKATSGNACRDQRVCAMDVSLRHDGRQRRGRRTLEGDCAIESAPCADRSARAQGRGRVANVPRQLRGSRGGRGTLPSAVPALVDQSPDQRYSAATDAQRANKSCPTGRLAGLHDPPVRHRRLERSTFQEIGPQSVRACHGLLRGPLRRAARDRVITDRCIDIRLPKLPDITKTFDDVPTAQKVDRVVSVMHDATARYASLWTNHHYQALVFMGAWLGPRWN